MNFIFSLIRRIKSKVLRILYLHADKIRFPTKSRRILIIRTDGIGDYVLFRNFLPFLASLEKYKGYKFYLLGNQLHKTLAETYDRNIFEKFIWIEPEIFAGTITPQRIKLAFKLKFKCFEIIINPCHSRTWEIDEFISKLGVRKVIGSRGDDCNYNSISLFNESFKFYTELIEVPDISNFEFFRNRFFFEKLIGKNLYECDLTISSSSFQQKAKGKIVIFPGAGNTLRRWKIENFWCVINELDKIVNLKLEFIIAGSINENLLAKEIVSNVNKGISISDCTGCLTLPELAELIEESELIISNETVAIHIAAATKTTAICISNGNHFGRFNPYPVSVRKNIYTVYPNEKFYDSHFQPSLTEECSRKSPYDINIINTKQVIETAITILLEGRN